jgi:hypothetical protein
MNKSAARLFGVTVLAAFSVAACGGNADTAGSGDTLASETASSATASAAPEATTASPTPTAPPVKKYTSQELAALMNQIRDGKGAKLAVMTGEDLSGQVEQANALLEQMTIEPKECRDIVDAGSMEPPAGAALATGVSIDAGAGDVATVTLMSGLDEDLLEKTVSTNAAQVTKCKAMSITMQGVKVEAATTEITGLGTTPGTLAYRTDITLPDGQQQSTVMAYAVKGGVLMSSMASGANAGTSGVSTAGALLDQAAKLIK